MENKIKKEEKKNSRRNLHERHRERQREKFKKGYLSTHEHIELLLYYPLKRKNTNEIAHELIKTFGGVEQIFCADELQLTAIKGVGKETALFIRNIAEIMRICAIEKCHPEKAFDDEKELEKYIKALFVGANGEKIIMLMFSENGRYIGCEKLGEGLYKSVVLHTKKAVLKAVEVEAKNVIVVHNHPNGVPVPSFADKEASVKIEELFRSVKINVKGQYVLANDTVVPIVAEK